MPVAFSPMMGPLLIVLYLAIPYFLGLSNNLHKFSTEILHLIKNSLHLYLLEVMYTS